MKESNKPKTIVNTINARINETRTPINLNKNLSTFNFRRSLKLSTNHCPEIYAILQCFSRFKD